MRCQRGIALCRVSSSLKHGGAGPLSPRSQYHENIVEHESTSEAIQEADNSSSGAEVDLLMDAKYYQDAALEYQGAYHELKGKFNEQAVLMAEASGALAATETKASTIQQELKAVGQAVVQYQVQLNAAKSCTQQHQEAIMSLREQVHALEISLASCADLPSVCQAQEGANLWEEMVNIIPGMVNNRRDAAVY